MAKITYMDLIGDYMRLEDIFPAGSVHLVGEPSATRAVFADEGGHQIVFKGTGFTYDAEKTTILTGVADEIVFQNDHKQPFADLVGHFNNAKQLAGLLVSPQSGVQPLLANALRHNDTVTGSTISNTLYGYAGNDTIGGGKGADAIFGGTGNDTLTGGTGSDRFYFLDGDGKDVVTDFDADGGGTNQDYIAVNTNVFSFKSVDHHKDTLVDFGDGDSMLLVGVKASHVTMEDLSLIG